MVWRSNYNLHIDLSIEMPLARTWNMEPDFAHGPDADIRFQTNICGKHRMIYCPSSSGRNERKRTENDARRELWRQKVQETGVLRAASALFACRFWMFCQQKRLNIIFHVHSEFGVSPIRRDRATSLPKK